MEKKEKIPNRTAYETPISCIRISEDQLIAVSCGKLSNLITIWSRTSTSQQFNHVENLSSETGRIIDIEMSKDASTLICSTQLNKLVIWKRNLNANDFFRFNPKKIIKSQDIIYRNIQNSDKVIKENIVWFFQKMKGITRLRKNVKEQLKK